MWKNLAVIIGIYKLPTGLPPAQPHLVDCMSHEAQPAFCEIHCVTAYDSRHLKPHQQTMRMFKIQELVHIIFYKLYWLI